MTLEEFESDRGTRQPVAHNVEIIGETVNRLRRHAPEVAEQIRASNKIVGLRNALIHGYDRVDYSALWSAVQESLPVLQAEVETLLREAEAQ